MLPQRQRPRCTPHPLIRQTKLRRLAHLHRVLPQQRPHQRRQSRRSSRSPPQSPHLQLHLLRCNRHNTLKQWCIRSKLRSRPLSPRSLSSLLRMHIPSCTSLRRSVPRSSTLGLLPLLCHQSSRLNCSLRSSLALRSPSSSRRPQWTFLHIRSSRPLQRFPLSLPRSWLRCSAIRRPCVVGHRA